MKAAVIYYSMGGNTAMAAEKLSAVSGAELIEIKPEKAYPDRGIRKFLWGGKSAVMAETPALQPYSFAPDRYDLIIFGFPVWAGTMAPPVRSFALENREALRDKKIAAFACQSGNGAEKAFRKLLECLGREAFAATMVLIDPKDRPKGNEDKIISEFRAKLGLDNPSR